MKYLSPQCYIKSTSDEGHIEGYASIFNVQDEQGDVVRVGAFKKNIAAMQESGKFPKMLWQHDVKKPIGIWDEIYEDEHGLFVKGRLLLDVKRGREIWSLLKNKAIDGLSIGYKTAKRVNGSELSDIELMEISIVTFPACTDAKIDTIKSSVQDEKAISETDKQIDSFAEIVKAVSRLTQTIYTLLK